jgi:hypothetical protein
MNRAQVPMMAIGDCRKSVSYLAELWEPSSNNIFRCPTAYAKVQRRPLVAANELSTGGHITRGAQQLSRRNWGTLGEHFQRTMLIAARFGVRLFLWPHDSY